MRIIKVEKNICVEFDITEETYKILKSIDWIETHSTIDSQKSDVVVKDLINLIISSIEYTGREGKS